MTNNVFLARQAVFDRHQATFGYELLYRDGPSTAAFYGDPDDATRCVIERTLLHWGVERIIGDRVGLINASASLILSGLHRAIPPERVIIELREDTPVDDWTIEAVVGARQEGYRFALDNVHCIDQLQRSRLLPHVGMVKVDVASAERSDVAWLAELARRADPGVLLVAEKVEDEHDFGRACDAGFDLFQGYYFAKPELLSSTARRTDASAALALLAEIPHEIGIERVERLVEGDPLLAYRVLAAVNSSSLALGRRVETLRHAIVLLGVIQVHHLATLLALAASSEATEETIIVGATRARLAKDLVASRGLGSSAFAAGLLSITGALYGIPPEEVLAGLGLGEVIEQAVLHGRGPIGEALQIARACEDADVERLEQLVPDRIEELMHAYGAATQWADGLRRSLVTLRPRPTPTTAERVHATAS